MHCTILRNKHIKHVTPRYFAHCCRYYYYDYLQRSRLAKVEQKMLNRRWATGVSAGWASLNQCSAQTRSLS